MAEIGEPVMVLKSDAPSPDEVLSRTEAQLAELDVQREALARYSSEYQAPAGSDAPVAGSPDLQSFLAPLRQALAAPPLGPREPLSSPEPEPVAVEEETEPSADWYYLVNDTQLGPVSASELQELIRQRTIDSETLIWGPDLPDWTPAGDAGVSDDLPVTVWVQGEPEGLTTSEQAGVTAPETGWYYLAADETVGPVDRHVLIGLVRNGELPASALVWYEGLADWQPADAPELGLLEALDRRDMEIQSAPDSSGTAIEASEPREETGRTPLPCASCGQPLGAGARFCRSCGQPTTLAQVSPHDE
jgi:hypothetical protein